ncbi:DUF1304 domain-containing protein [Streptomyces sp. SS8]
MNVFSQVAALTAAAVHVFVWPLESFLYGSARVRLFLTGSTADAPEVRLWRVNVGFYNLFLALGLIAGVVSLHTGDANTGRSLIVYVCLFMVAAGTVLFVSDRGLWRGSLGQAAPPAIALAAHALLD